MGKGRSRLGPIMLNIYVFTLFSSLNPPQLRYQSHYRYRAGPPDEAGGDWEAPQGPGHGIHDEPQPTHHGRHQTRHTWVPQQFFLPAFIIN